MHANFSFCCTFWTMWYEDCTSVVTVDELIAFLCCIDLEIECTKFLYLIKLITIMNWYFHFMCICQVGLRLSGLKIVKKKKKKKRTRGTSVHKQISLPSSHSSLSKENFSNISMQQIFLLWVSDMKGYIFLTIKEMSSTL